MTTTSGPSEDRPANAGFSLVVLSQTTMTTSQLRSFPPADDAIDFIKQVDWQDVGLRTKNGVKNLLLVAAAISEKSFDFHIWLAKKLG